MFVDQNANDMYENMRIWEWKLAIQKRQQRDSGAQTLIDAVTAS